MIFRCRLKLVPQGREIFPALTAEQNLRLARAAADRHCIIEKGVVKFEGTTAELEENGEVIRAYLGVYK